MGIIADNMAEVIERTKNTMEGAITDLRDATSVELVVNGAQVWVNVDGVCALRVQSCPVVVTPTSKRMAGQVVSDE